MDNKRIHPRAVKPFVHRDFMSPLVGVGIPRVLQRRIRRSAMRDEEIERYAARVAEKIKERNHV